MPRRILCFLAALVLLTPVPACGSSFEEVVSRLTSAQFSERRNAVEDLVTINDPRTQTILVGMLEGSLFFRKADKRVVRAEREGHEYSLTDVLSGEALGRAPKRALKKIKANNRLRNIIRVSMSVVRLGDPDPMARVAAADALMKAPTAEFATPLRGAIDAESDDKVRAKLEVAYAAVMLATGTAQEQLAALPALENALSQEVRGLLQSVLDDPGAGSELKIKAAAALRNITDKITLYSHVQNVFFGLSLGSVLLLAAVGLAITFGVMGVINMAHGEMVMLGAYTTFVVQSLMPDAIEYSLFVALPAAFIVAGACGIAIERGVIRFLYGRPLETLLATFGLSLVLQQAVRTIFSPLNRVVIAPDWMSGSLIINPALSLTYNRLYIIVFALLVLVTLVGILARTRFGLHLRAVTQNRDMAKAMGIRTARVDALTFGLGSGVAGLAGVALSQLTNVGPNMGQAYIVDSFMVVVFGGVGNLMGTFFGAMTLGIANKFLEPFTGTVLAKILVLVFIIIFIQRRPRGLFALTGRAVDT